MSEDLRAYSYQVYGGCSLAEAIERYRAALGRWPTLIVAHPTQAATSVVRHVQAADWCQCSAIPGQGPWYFAPSRKGMKEARR